MYEHPYPSARLAAESRFVACTHERFDVDTMQRRAEEFEALTGLRRSVRMFSDESVPCDLIESAIGGRVR